MTTSPCYSPSRGGTQDFQRCPRLYSYTQRWAPYPVWKPEIVLGNAVHAGLAAHYDSQQELGYATKGFAQDIVGEILDQQWQENPGLTNEQAYKHCVRAIKEALSIDLLGDTGTVLAVEQEMGPEKCHPDLVIQHTAGDAGGLTWLQVIDWKFSYTLLPEWVSKRLASYETLWQLWHYAWRVQQEFSLPCAKVSVVQMAAQPKPFARLVSYDVTPELLANWERSAKDWWRLMVSGYDAQNLEGCRKYGEQHLCDFYAGCWTLAGDETKFEMLYQRKG